MGYCFEQVLIMLSLHLELLGLVEEGLKSPSGRFGWHWQGRAVCIPDTLILGKAG
jgi:hypothetical protein